MNKKILPLALTAFFLAYPCAAKKQQEQKPVAKITLVEKVKEGETKEIRQVVKTYLNSIYDKKYSSAYNLLTEKSKKKHSYKEFVGQNDAGVTFYDFRNMAVKKLEESVKGPEESVIKKSDKKIEKFSVTLNLYEDPAQHSIILQKEKNQLKVIWNRGRPSAPYE